jgi:hypothetical protein
LKTMPALGKSGTSRMSAWRRTCSVSVELIP